MNRGSAIALMLSTAVLASGFMPPQEKPRLKLIHADALRHRKEGDVVRQELVGNVALQRGATTITCDLATQVGGRDPITLVGRVEIKDSLRTLRADTVYFYQQEGKQVASGHVVHITRSDTTWAKRMTYFQRERRAVSEGDVKVVNTEERSRLTAGFTEYYRDRGYARILDEPVWTRFDSLGQQMVVVGDTMELFGNGDTTVVRGHVRIEHPKAVATCGLATFYRGDERTLLLDSPAITLRNQNVSGDTMELKLERARLSYLLVKGNAVATSEADTLEPGKWVNRLSGRRMEFFFQDDELQRIVVQQQASSLNHIIEDREFKGTNEVSGDRIEVFFDNGTLARVVVQSAPDVATGKYSPP